MADERPKKDADDADQAAAGNGSAKPRTPPDLDLAVLQALILLSTADCLELADHEWPRESICRWLDRCDLRQARGMLLAALDRWQRLHPPATQI